MKLGIVLIALVVLAFAVFKIQARVSSATTGAEFTGIDWRPTSIAGETVPDDTEQFVRFEVDGSISGHGGCNRFFGALQSVDGGIEVGPLGATRMACPEPAVSIELSFVEALQAGVTVARNESRMALRDEGGRASAGAAAVLVLEDVLAASGRSLVRSAAGTALLLAVTQLRAAVQHLRVMAKLAAKKKR